MRGRRLGGMVIRTGIIGFSEGNGHPFSFSAFLNGYDEARFGDAGWPVILNYLRLQGPERFGIDNARVTHAWTQDVDITRKLCAACRIDTVCKDWSEMFGQIDALIVARDDWESHFQIAMPFLKKGIPVFVDKPLTLDLAELEAFLPYLANGQLMSCAGLRYAAELDPMRLTAPATGPFRLLSGTVLNRLDRYGIHLIEAVASLGEDYSRAVSVTRLEAPYEAYQIQFANGVPFHLNCLGDVGKTFHMSVFGTTAHSHFDLHDNFSAFRRTLEAFFDMVRSKQPAIDPAVTEHTIRLIIAAGRLAPGETARL